MSKHFRLTTSAASTVLELTRDPKQFDEFIRMIYDRRFTGQFLVDCRHGVPLKIGFPQVTRVRVQTGPKPPKP